MGPGIDLPGKLEAADQEPAGVAASMGPGIDLPGKRAEVAVLQLDPDASMGPGIDLPGKEGFVLDGGATTTGFNGARDRSPGKVPARVEKHDPAAASMGPGIDLPGKNQHHFHHPHEPLLQWGPG